MRSWRSAVTRCNAGCSAVRFSRYSAVVRTLLSRSGRKPGVMPGTSKKRSVAKTYGFTVLTVPGRLLGKRVCRFTLKSSPKDQSLLSPPSCPL
ncbi:hypothetical protein D9M72_346300 [compost metagenome]